MALYRAIIKKKMAGNETIECEHHTIWTHFRLMQSILREPAQQAVSLFLTNRRLLRIQSTIMPDQPPTADNRDSTSIDEVSLDRIRDLKKRSSSGGEKCFLEQYSAGSPIFFMTGLR